MNKEIIELVVSDICSDFKDIILNGLNDNKEKLPYTISCIEFLSKLNEKGLNYNIHFIGDEMIEIINNEMINYLK